MQSGRLQARSGAVLLLFSRVSTRAAPRCQAHAQSGRAGALRPLPSAVRPEASPPPRARAQTRAPRCGSTCRWPAARWSACAGCRCAWRSACARTAAPSSAGGAAGAAGGSRCPRRWRRPASRTPGGASRSARPSSSAPGRRCAAASCRRRGPGARRPAPAQAGAHAAQRRRPAGRRALRGRACGREPPSAPPHAAAPQEQAGARRDRAPRAQFVYDAWYALLTPDRDFPRELRRLMNTAFGVIAARAHRCVNLRQMLLECAPRPPAQRRPPAKRGGRPPAGDAGEAGRGPLGRGGPGRAGHGCRPGRAAGHARRDVSDLLMEQVELYRDTRESIAQARRPGAARLSARSPRRSAPRPAAHQRHAAPTRLAAQPCQCVCQSSLATARPTGGFKGSAVPGQSRTSRRRIGERGGRGARRATWTPGARCRWRRASARCRRRCAPRATCTRRSSRPPATPPPCSATTRCVPPPWARARPSAHGRRPSRTQRRRRVRGTRRAAARRPRQVCQPARGAHGAAGTARVTAARRAQVLRHISEGLVAFLLERHDHAKPMIRSVARELLCSCALRSAILFFNPYSLNRVRAYANLRRPRARPRARPRRCVRRRQAQGAPAAPAGACPDGGHIKAGPWQRPRGACVAHRGL